MSKPFTWARSFLLKVYFKFFLEYFFVKAKNKRDQQFLFHSKHGFNIYLDLEHDVDIRFYIGVFEYETIWFYKRLLKPGMTVFDIGGNIGIFSLIAEARLKNRGRVYAFEPADRASETFKRNIEVNNFDHIFLYKLGMADKAGILTFNVCADDAYNSIGETPFTEILYTTTIQVTSIDEFCNENNIKKIDILKIDTEGAESQVIAGGKQMLGGNNSPIIFCEYNQKVQSGENIIALESLLKEYGYELYDLRFGILRKFDHDHKVTDIVAMKKSHIDCL